MLWVVGELGMRAGDRNGAVFGLEDREYREGHGAADGAGDKVKTGDETGTEVGTRLGLGWKGMGPRRGGRWVAVVGEGH